MRFKQSECYELSKIVERLESVMEEYRGKRGSAPDILLLSKPVVRIESGNKVVLVEAWSEVPLLVMPAYYGMIDTVFALSEQDYCDLMQLLFEQQRRWEYDMAELLTRASGGNDAEAAKLWL